MSTRVEGRGSARAEASPDRIDVWRADLDVPPARLAALSGLLAPDEERRAASMQRGADRWRAARGLLREILARYAGVPPAGIAFSRDAGGKLALGGRHARPAFNLSHSRSVLLVAVGIGRRIGVDVERVPAAAVAERVGDRWLAPAERTGLARLQPERRPEAFTAVWARKEAYLKATGAGLGGGLGSFAVSADPDAAPRLLAAPPGEDPAAWTLLDLDAPRGFRAALAVDGGPFGVRFRSP